MRFEGTPPFTDEEPSERAIELWRRQLRQRKDAELCLSNAIRQQKWMVEHHANEWEWLAEWDAEQKAKKDEHALPVAGGR